MHNAAQIPPLTKHPPTDASCSTWSKNTEDSDCSQRALGNCAVPTGQPASLVALSDHSGATDAALCNSNTPLRELLVLDIFQDRRQPGHRNAALGGAAADQPVPPGEPLDDSPLPNCPIRDTVFTERDMQLLTELRRASAVALPRCVVSRYATAWAESLEGARSPALGSALSLPLSPALC